MTLPTPQSTVASMERILNKYVNMLHEVSKSMREDLYIFFDSMEGLRRGHRKMLKGVVQREDWPSTNALAGAIASILKDMNCDPDDAIIKDVRGIIDEYSQGGNA